MKGFIYEREGTARKTQFCPPPATKQTSSGYWEKYNAFKTLGIIGHCNCGLGLPGGVRPVKLHCKVDGFEDGICLMRVSSQSAAGADDANFIPNSVLKIGPVFRANH